jgi:hypothetical protein
MCYECIGLSVTRICDIRFATATLSVTVHLLSAYFSLRLLVYVYLTIFINITTIFYFLMAGSLFFELTTI